MSSNDDLTVAQLFDAAFDLQQKLESNQIDGKAEIYDELLKQLISLEEKIDELHLFSDNEDISEVSSSELRYFILYALIGWTYEFRVGPREQRSSDVPMALKYFLKYLQLCQNYGLVKNIPKEHDDPSDKVRVHTQEDRQIRIQKMKEKKALEQSIGKLRAMTHVDDETKRQLHSEQIKWWIQQATEEISALKDERNLIEFSRVPTPSDNRPKPVSTNTKLPINGPFTLLTTKDRLYQQAVGGAGYPSLPTMTVEEFYDDLMARQTQQSVPGASSKTTPATTEHLEEIDDSTHRANVRRMDEYKDDNPRGSGNRYNRS